MLLASMFFRWRAFDSILLTYRRKSPDLYSISTGRSTVQYHWILLNLTLFDRQYLFSRRELRNGIVVTIIVER